MDYRFRRALSFLPFYFIFLLFVCDASPVTQQAGQYRNYGKLGIDITNILYPLISALSLSREEKSV